MLGWIIVGIIAGWLTGKLMRGAGYGILMDLVLGLVGAVIGGWLLSLVGVHSYGFIGSLTTATVGAVVLVAAARFLSR